MPFRAIMKDLVDGTPGATGAIFIDWEGEAVDQYAVDGEVYQLKVMGAYKGVILGLINEAQKNTDSGQVRTVSIKMENYNVLIAPVKEGYAVTLVLESGAIMSRAAYRAGRAVEALKNQM